MHMHMHYGQALNLPSIHLERGGGTDLKGFKSAPLRGRVGATGVEGVSVAKGKDRRREMQARRHD